MIIALSTRYSGLDLSIAIGFVTGSSIIIFWKTKRKHLLYTVIALLMGAIIVCFLNNAKLAYYLISVIFVLLSLGLNLFFKMED